ncbi:hypothetical protein D0T84_14870 [Dysgonomonas sp. 521]|uniref:hypothetical protein n=1 Tax=Dysgonomonas sp. 521 TaxID=2302932 RepID=UPI0013D7B75C|nr:hypothetical protein [Dysgonomonas sp. 521]NDV96184.1 hypothetical protein [Dysgonomonas sp. 521]
MGDVKIPGKIRYGWREVIYIEVPAGKDFDKDIFQSITELHKPFIPRAGSVINKNFVIIPPDGISYSGLSYNEDIEGWRQQIFLGAKQLGLKIGIIVDRKDFVTSHGITYNLKDCTFERYNFYDANWNLVTSRTPVNKEDIL